MMSKELLSHSLLSSYRDFLGSPSQNGELKKELMHLATNPEMFLPDEIAVHLESFSFMEELSKWNKLLCHIDGSVTITYPEGNKEIYTYDSMGNILVIHCSGGQNGVVVTGREGFAVAARPDLFTD